MNCIGIDLGTCLSSVAVLENGMPVALNIETGSSQLMGNDRAIPSSVFIEEDGSIILGQRADNSRLKNPSRYRKEFKRDLGTNEPYHIGDFEILPEEIYREFFKYFKKKAEERLSGEIEKIVITHPAIFTGYKKEMIKKAAEMAGIINVELIDEPTAAAVYYSTKEKIENGEKLLVYDLGGGTFDVSLITKEGDGFSALTPPLGIERCGGVDFQRKIYEDIIDKFSSELFPILSKKDLLSKQMSSMIEAESIKIKHNLSFSQKSEAVIMIPSTFGFYNYEIQRNKFEAMIKEYVEATCRKIEDIVKNANIKMQDIDKVLLVGGSSRVPYVEEMIKKTTGKPVCKDIDTELVVCYGAAIWGNRKRKDTIIESPISPINPKVQVKTDGIMSKGKEELERNWLYLHLRKLNTLKKFEKDINYLKQQVNLMVKSRMEYLEENISKWSNDINISSKVSIINIKTSVKTIVEEMTSKLTVKIDTEQIAWCNTTLNPYVLKEINKLKDEFNMISSNNKIDSKQKYMVNIKPNISLSIINVLLPPMLMTGITPLVLLSISSLVVLPLSKKELMMAAIKTEFAKKVKEQFMGQKCDIEDRIAKEVVGYIDEAVIPIKTALEEIN